MTVQTSQYNIFQQLTSVRVVRVSNLAGLYLNGPLNNGVGATLTAPSPAALVIDGVTLALNDRVLLAAQTNANENGIYVVTSTNWVLTRSADQQSIEQLKIGQFIPVGAGSANAGNIWLLVEPLPAMFGVSAMTFAQS
ncbi:MAG: hypothetical protein EPO02_13690 [Nitrospirae bacterium]|nr:MAG: hypothetical protein EPO02_13690 [Nitrospirota bacterium]